MSDTIDDIINNLDEKIEKGGNIEMEVVEDLKEDVKEVSKEATERQKKTMRKKIADLAELVEVSKDFKGGPSRAPGTRKKGGAGANPKPPNINTEGVRCYIRYNNMGIPYRTCNDGEGKKPRKPPSQITPSQTPEKFAEQHGGYGNLGKGQRREYHRLWMREKRANEKVIRFAGEEMLRLQKNLLKQEKAKIRQERLQEQIDKKQKAQDRLDYKKAIKDMSYKPSKKEIAELKKKFGIKDKRFNDEIKELKEEKKAVDEVYDNYEEEIKDGKKNIKSSYGAGNVGFSKKEGEIIMSFS